MPITSSFQPMFTQISDVTNSLAVSLLTHYSFDLGGYSTSELVKRWENQYPSNWVHLAVIEALYQGRYKAVSVQQILTLWLRRNHPSYHFNVEFECLICNKLPEDLRWNSLPPLPPALPTASNHRTIKEAMRNYQSSLTANSSYRQNIQKQQLTRYHQSEVASTASEENTSKRSKALPPASTSMVATASQPTTTNTSKRGLTTLAQARNKIETESESILGKLHKPEKSLISETIAKLLPPARNHPPIEQFTPEKTDSTDTFTSKLKAVITVSSEQ